MTFTTVTLHYLDIEGFPSTAALGENLNLFLKDAGIDFNYVQHTYAEWAPIKEDLIKNKNVPFASLPFIEVDGKIFTKTAPILRYLSKQLGKYNGDTEEESYRVDAVADVTRDHYGTQLPVFRTTDEERLKEHFEKDTKKYLAVYNTIYGQSEGPYILGEKISYADFLVYHNIDDDKDTWKHTELLEKEYPHVAKFEKAFIQRPNLANYIASLKETK